MKEIKNAYLREASTRCPDEGWAEDESLVVMVEKLFSATI